VRITTARLVGVVLTLAVLSCIPSLVLCFYFPPKARELAELELKLAVLEAKLDLLIHAPEVTP